MQYWNIWFAIFFKITSSSLLKLFSGSMYENCWDSYHFSFDCAVERNRVVLQHGDEKHQDPRFNPQNIGPVAMKPIPVCELKFSWSKYSKTRQEKYLHLHHWFCIHKQKTKCLLLWHDFLNVFAIHIICEDALEEMIQLAFQLVLQLFKI